jgi:hypothetical protein
MLCGTRRRPLTLCAVLLAGCATPHVRPPDLQRDSVYATWKAYVKSKDGRYSSRAGTPSPYWNAAEQAQWPVYDLASFYLIDSAIVEEPSIERINEPSATEYRITARVRAKDTVHASTWWSVLDMTVYAVRERDRWVLANALPRNTRLWRRDTVGPITYVIQPGYRYNRERAQRAVTFTDSIAQLFHVARLSPIAYYLTSTVDDVYRIMGLQSPVKFGPVGGVAQPVNHQLFSGIPALGEEYRHELAHLVLAPLVGPRTTYFVSEGVPTWLGGTTGLDFPTAVRGLASFLATRPSVSLDSVLSGSMAAAQLYPAAAVVVQMVFEAGGLDAVKELYDAGPSLADLRTALERLLNRPWSAIVVDWRGRATMHRSP